MIHWVCPFFIIRVRRPVEHIGNNGEASIIYLHSNSSLSLSLASQLLFRATPRFSLFFESANDIITVCRAGLRRTRPESVDNHRTKRKKSNELGAAMRIASLRVQVGTGNGSDDSNAVGCSLKLPPPHHLFPFPSFGWY